MRYYRSDSYLQLDNSKLGSTQRWIQDMLTLTCCQDHILTENIWFVWSETFKHHIVEMRGGVTDAGRTNNEDRATQSMEAGG